MNHIDGIRVPIQATGATTFVQRGVQRASFRQTDDRRAARVRQGGPHAGEICLTGGG